MIKPDNKTIWKYEMCVENYQEIEMPLDATILTLQTQSEKPCLWCIVKTSNKKTIRKFRMFGTGHPIKTVENLKYIGSIQLYHNKLMFHVFEVINNKYQHKVVPL